ncbi:MAG: cation:proton antiporter [Nitrospinae bacterium]|nr:cation:proton antiporter [Nitrospinota bacterium]
MNDFPLLRDLIIILAVALPITFAFHKMKLPAIAGYLVTGIVIGPYGIRLIFEMEAVKTLSEVGVALLLFTVGLEFSLTRMTRNIKTIVGSGGIQVVLTILGVLTIAYSAGYSLQQSFFFGFLISLSSTAIVLKMYTDRGEIDSPHGKFSVGILLFQDLCVVPMILLIPVLAGAGDTSLKVIVLTLLKAVIAMSVIFFASRLLVPTLLNQVVKLKSREFLLLFVVLLCLGTAWLTQYFGLSLAMGAFIAGLIISESEYSSQVVVEILPFRDFFSSIFFISIGMLLKIYYLSDHLIYLMLLTTGIIIFKIVLTLVSVVLFQKSLRIAFISALRLAQIGEFSFLLAEAGLRLQLIGNDDFQNFLVSAILSMITAPLLIHVSYNLSLKLQSLFSVSKTGWGEGEGKEMNEHVIIAGYGLNGRSLTQVLKETRISYIVIEINTERINAGKAAGVQMMYGDITSKEILHKAGIERAKIIVFAISDPLSIRSGINIARQMSPHIHIIARTLYASEVEDLMSLGANQVIPMDFETSVEIFSRVLKEYNIPGNLINRYVDMIRMDGYGMLRGLSISHEKLKDLYKYLLMTTTENYLVTGDSTAKEKSLKELDLRHKTGAVIIAIVRKGEVKVNPDPDLQIETGDLLILLGSHAQLNRALNLLSAKI